jgi:hypothetical protein
MTEEPDEQANGAPGAAVDARGRPVLDPTRNVLDLVDAAIKRQDDLRQMADEHQREMANLRASYDERVRDAESRRIDAIRAVDVGQVQRAAEVQQAQALTLANQVTATADAFRAALAAALEPITKSIEDLRRAQYEAQGQKTQGLDSRSLVFAVIGAVGLLAAIVIPIIVK